MSSEPISPGEIRLFVAMKKGREARLAAAVEERRLEVEAIGPGSPTRFRKKKKKKKKRKPSPINKELLMALYEANVARQLAEQQEEAKKLPERVYEKGRPTTPVSFNLSDYTGDRVLTPPTPSPPKLKRKKRKKKKKKKNKEEIRSV